jgi:hypothetical protein
MGRPLKLAFKYEEPAEFAKPAAASRLSSLLAEVRGVLLFGFFLFRVGWNGRGIDKFFLRLVHVLLLTPRGVIGSLFRLHDPHSVALTIIAFQVFEEDCKLLRVEPQSVNGNSRDHCRD